MNKPSVAIWGVGGHAKVVADVIACEGKYEIRGYVEYPIVGPNPTPMFLGQPVYRGPDALDTLRSLGISHLLFGFGDCAARLRFEPLALGKGFSLATAIHPRATVAQGVQIGDGTVVVAGAVINPAAVIGRNVIVNTCASVDHDCTIEDGVHLSPGVRLGGGVSVGRAAWIAMGAIIAPKVRIGHGAIIGAGSVVLHDIPDGVLAYGSPARVRRPT